MNDTPCYPTNSTPRRLFERGQEPSPELFKHFRGHREPITALNFHPNLPQVLSGGKDGFVMCWDYKDDNARALRFEGHELPVNDVAYNCDGDLLVSGSDDATVRIWVPTRRGDTRVFKAHHSAVRSVTFSPTGPEIASASDDKTVKLWSVGLLSHEQNGKLTTHSFIGSYNFHTNWVRSVRFHPNGQLLCSASDDGTLGIFDVRSRSKVGNIKMHGSTPNHAEFNPVSSMYLGATNNGSFQIYDIRTKRLVQIYNDIHLRPITKFTFHPSGDFVFTVSEDKRIKILDIVEGRPIFTLTGPADTISTVACSKDGSVFATGGVDKNLLIWKPFLLPYTPSELEEQLGETEESSNSNGENIGNGVSTASEGNEMTLTA